ncbi:MAG: lactate racemase domain-containing protein [candidate division Zixibacteria bacterium]|nr:lactate racemase domain-containing protein [candidate division Zixibacteria bacterium]
MDIAPGDTLTEKAPADDFPEWSSDRFLRNLQAAGLTEFLRRGKPLVVVNDAFRPTPTGKILAALQSYDPSFRADFVVACGNHPKPSPSDMESIFDGYSLPADSRLFFHDSRDRKTMVPAGEIDGQTVYLNRVLFGYPSVMVIGSVEPHYFAGFTGGRKSLIPGLCDFETTRRNHALAVSPEARPLRLNGNPVAENLDRLMGLLSLSHLFSIQIVAGRNQKILDCFCGDLAASFAEAVILSEQVYSFPLEKTYDLVVAEMRPPLDRNLYQLQKGIENCVAAVRDGGTLIVVSPCREGIGNDEFYRLAERLRTPETVLAQAAAENPPLGIHKLCRIVRLSRRISVKALTELEPDVLRRVFLEPAEALQAERQKFQKGGEKHMEILLVRDAEVLVAKKGIER